MIGYVDDMLGGTLPWARLSWVSCVSGFTQEGVSPSIELIRGQVGDMTKGVE